MVRDPVAWLSHNYFGVTFHSFPVGLMQGLPVDNSHSLGAYNTLKPDSI